MEGNYLTAVTDMSVETPIVKACGKDQGCTRQRPWLLAINSKGLQHQIKKHGVCVDYRTRSAVIVPTTGLSCPKGASGHEEVNTYFWSAWNCTTNLAQRVTAQLMKNLVINRLRAFH